MLRMRTLTRLDRYERGIVRNLIEAYHYSAPAARALFMAYRPVLKLMDRYDSSKDWAERFHHAKHNGLTADQWVKRIKRVRREERHEKYGSRQGRRIAASTTQKNKKARRAILVR
ncbi:hypothetical protein [Paenibacillus turpanensis]|uniref:hypothetical protein n=1 Tax=Paenibacillus turpanensis TaxID=2689078 RepID=UPI00140DEA15|nr:hypothetical protein [Paenibacillus turpanensis]